MNPCGKGLDTEKLHDELVIGAGYMAKGIKDAGEWHAAMAKEFGPEIKPYLPDMYVRSKATYDAAISGIKGAEKLSTPRQKLIDQVNKINAGLERKIAVKKGLAEPNAPRGPKPFDVETEALRTELKRLEHLERRANRLEAAKQTAREKVAWAKEGLVKPTKAAPLVPDQELIALRKELASLREPSDAVKLVNKIKARNERLEKLTSQYEKRIAAGDFAQRVREKLPVTRESFQKQQAFNAVKNRFEDLVAQKQRENQPPMRQLLDKTVAVSRWSKLTGITTLFKIGAAATTRIAQKIGESIVSEALRNIPGKIGEIARGAGPEGAGVAELPTYIKGVFQGIKDIPDVLKGKISNKERAFPTPFSGKVTKVLDATSVNLHAAGKRPAYRAAYEHAKTYLTKEARALGKDLSDPEVYAQIEEASKAAGDRSIFLRDNAASRTLSVVTRYLERPKGSLPEFVTAKVLRFLLPIVRVPTNIASETLSMSGGGLISGTFKTYRVMRKGLELATPEEKASILRSYRNGMIGAGLFMTGYFLKDHFARPWDSKQPYQPGELREGEAELLGVTIPKWVMHSPPALVMQAGADTAHMMEAKGIPTAYGSAMMHVIRDVPFIREVSAIDSLLGGGWESNPSRELGKQVQGVIPQGLQNIATWTDTHDSEGYPIVRKPSGTGLQQFGQQIELGVPGLRQNVQPKQSRGGGKSEAE